MAIEERASTHVYHQKRMFTKEELDALEARCVHEEPPYCSAACPLRLDARAMTAALAAGDFDSALALYAKITPLPHILASGCEAPCRKKCRLGELGESVDLPALEHAAARFGQRTGGTGMLRLKKKKTAAVFGSGAFAAFYTGEMARKAYPLTVYSGFENAAGFLAAAAPFADAEGVRRDAESLEAAGVAFVRADALTPELFAAEREKYDILCVSPEFLSLLGGGEVNEAFMLCESRGVISAPADKKGVLDAAFGARKAALTADRLAQGLSPDNTRGEEGAVETRLYTNMKGVEGSRAVRPVGELYTRDEAVREAGRCIQCRCDECIKGCAYLQHYKKYPKKLTREINNNVNIIMGDHMMNKPMNACALCSQCSVVCPNGYDVAEICLRARRTMVDTDKMPLAPHEFALNDMEFSNTEAFLCRPQPGFDKCRYVFFPGCQAAAIAPETVERAYRDLSARLPGGVGLLLGCCGAIAEWAGRVSIYNDAVKLLDDSLARLGNPEIIAGCPTCAKMLADHENVKVTGIWDVLNEIGLPAGAKGLEKPAAMHDSCGARGDGHTQSAVRRLAEKMGCTLVDTEYSGDSSPCCGYGGLVQYANREVAHEMAQKCVSGTDAPYITYCMACRDRLAREGRESRHILELAYGSDAGSPPDISEKRYNRLALKKRLLNDIWKETTPEMDCGFAIDYLPEARAAMDDRMILESDVTAVLQYARETGEAIQDCGTGLIIARRRLGNVTFWVKYEERDGGYLVHSAYSHRMNVQTR
jgi:Fe-S oxidoreductase